MQGNRTYRSIIVTASAPYFIIVMPCRSVGGEVREPNLRKLERPWMRVSPSGIGFQWDSITAVILAGLLWPACWDSLVGTLEALGSRRSGTTSCTSRNA